MLSHNTQKILNSQTNQAFYINKKPGETLAILIDRFRLEQHITKGVPVTYAGRLDPMAEGLVLLLVGEDCKKKDEYLGLDKTYEFQVLFGIATDTFDMLGLITNSEEYLPTENEILISLKKIKNTKEFSYPSYSSKPVAGMPLFMHAKAGTLPKQMPTMHGTVQSIILQNTKMVEVEELVRRSIETIKSVEGDFRQEEIIKSWERFLEDNKDRKVLLATFEANVSTGVYIRTIATMFGGTALAYSINRIKIGS